jgi:hypothetical protein
VVSSTFAITEIEYDPNAAPNPTVTLTWRNSGAATYIAYLSPDLSDWGEDLDDSISAEDDENTEDSDHITVTFPARGRAGGRGGAVLPHRGTTVTVVAFQVIFSWEVWTPAMAPMRPWGRPRRVRKAS